MLRIFVFIFIEWKVLHVSDIAFICLEYEYPEQYKKDKKYAERYDRVNTHPLDTR
jgi:hypothetical protein